MTNKPDTNIEDCPNEIHSGCLGDAHSECKPDTIEEEFKPVLSLINSYLNDYERAVLKDFIERVKEKERERAVDILNQVFPELYHPKRYEAIKLIKND